MTTLETAIKYGVPMPGTCNALCFENDTLFEWWKKPGENEYILMPKQPVTVTKINSFVFWAEAPQMHEIAPLLPACISTSHNYHFNMGYWEDARERRDYLVYVNGLGQKLFNEVFIINNHFAEAFAEMYLKLKQNELI